MSIFESRIAGTVYCKPERPSSLNVNYVGLSVCHEKLIEYVVRLRLFLLRQGNRNFYTIIEDDENSLKTFTAWAANKVSRHGVLRFSHFPLCFNPLHLSNVLICCTLYFPGLSSNFETGTLPKTLKRRAELIANCAFPYSVLATSSRNGQFLSESRWGSRFFDVICAQRY